MVDCRSVASLFNRNFNMLCSVTIVMNSFETNHGGKSTLPVLSPTVTFRAILIKYAPSPCWNHARNTCSRNHGKKKVTSRRLFPLVTSHLRLVAKIAMGYRGYGLPISDLISEGNLGMMHAVKSLTRKGFSLIPTPCGGSGSDTGVYFALLVFG